ncbi:MAG: hypothetical protein PHX74_11420, partial [Candidatus Sumerlaeales bacterium]|nr:hypothetical protein [Candidatus Sumerlaeales bacterium]
IDGPGHSFASEEDVFIRLNVGKIPLTNAELIKALFLNRSNFEKRTQDGSTKSHDEVRLRQLEIATQWDAMEEELSDDMFWYFINGKENKSRPRINYLFNIISGTTASAGDDYATFRFFNDKFCKNADVGEQWEEIYSKYQILREWFKDRFYYHRIGYLLTFGGKLGTLLDQYLSPTRLKTAFMAALSEQITKVIAWDGQEDLAKKEDDPRIRRILLLHNVITMANHENDDARFPFDKFHTVKWDIEHIQAIADPEKKPVEPEDRKRYLSDAAVFVSNEALKGEIGSFVNDEAKIKDNDKFGVIYGRIIAHFAEEDVESSETDSLSNLALLDPKTNRGYGNAVFPVKRVTILKKDQEGQQFIPICTLYAFLKYYTRENAGDLNRWRMLDREAYMADIKAKLSAFLQKGETR